MTARAAVGDLLAAHLDGVDVVAYARVLDGPSQPTVMVALTGARPGPAVGLTTWTVQLLLVGAKTVGADADDQVDGLLEDVVAALDHVADAGIVWSSATRVTFGDTQPAYEVTCEVTTTKE